MGPALLPVSSLLPHHQQLHPSPPALLPCPCCSVKEKAGMGPSSAREDLKQGEAQEAEAPLGVRCGQLHCATLIRSAGMTTWQACRSARGTPSLLAHPPSNCKCLCLLQQPHTSPCLLLRCRQALSACWPPGCTRTHPAAQLPHGIPCCHGTEPKPKPWHRRAEACLPAPAVAGPSGCCCVARVNNAEMKSSIQGPAQPTWLRVAAAAAACKPTSQQAG